MKNESMKKTLIILSISVGVPLLIYLLFAFVINEFNPSLWEESSRGLLVMLASIFGISAAAIYIISSKDNDNQ